MLLPIQELQWVEFKEHPVKILSHKQIESFDIIIDDLKGDSFNHQNYCIKLIFKIFSLRKRSRLAFFDYQCKHIEYPWHWLNSVYLLLDYNWKIFLKSGQQKKLIELIDLIEELRTKYPRENKLLNQNTIVMKEKKTPLKNSSKENKGYLNLESFPYIWDGPINILVDMYYQMLTIKNEKGEPLIGNTKSEVADHLIHCYRQADGSLLKRSTILTILTPSKVDKRPTIDKRIDLQKIIDKHKAEKK